MSRLWWLKTRAKSFSKYIVYDTQNISDQLVYCKNKPLTKSGIRHYIHMRNVWSAT